MIVRILPKAQADLDNIYSFIAKDSLKYAEVTIAKITADISRLGQFHEMGYRVRNKEGLRELIVEKQYAVWYVIRRDSVLIVRVWHGKRNRRG